jgi:hypothetical protein
VELPLALGSNPLVSHELGHGVDATVQAAAAEGLVDLGDAAVLAVAEVSDQGDDVEAELVLGQGIAALGFGAVRLTVTSAVGVVAAPDVEGESEQSGEGSDGAPVLVVGPQTLSTGGARGEPGLEVFAACWSG